MVERPLRRAASRYRSCLASQHYSCWMLPVRSWQAACHSVQFLVAVFQNHHFLVTCGTK